ncbi:MAG: pyridoxal kinase PdxY [Dongiaceae bacterium]
MIILSIQSRVAFGHVGNSAAVFPLQRLGHMVWPVDTTSLSNHLGYKTWTGQVRPPEEVREIIDGLGQLGVLSTCDAVLSGYLGDAGTAQVVRDTVSRVRTGNPDAIYCCDPVIGDEGTGLYVRPDIPKAIAQTLLPLADIALPNAFELRQFTGGGTDSLSAAIDSARTLASRMRPGAIVVVTSLLRQDGAADQIETLAVGPESTWLAATPRYQAPPHGAGDCFTALFLGHWGRMRDLEFALGFSVSAIHGVIKASAEAGVNELMIIPMQHELDPTAFAFPPRRVA